MKTCVNVGVQRACVGGGTRELQQVKWVHNKTHLLVVHTEFIGGRLGVLVFTFITGE